MDIFKKHIELSKLSDAHTDLNDANKMVDSCDPKIIDTLCRLDTFLNKHKESKDSSEYNVIFKEAKRLKAEFIDNCII